MALQYMRHNKNIKVKAITTCFGNCNVNQVMKNVAKIRKANAFDGSDGPIITLGCSNPLKQVNNEPPIDATYFHGSDGLGDSNYKDVDIPVPDVHSAEMIIQFANEVRDMNSTAPGSVELALIMLGPLTNLALALQKDPGVCSSISKVFVMVCMGCVFNWIFGCIYMSVC